MRRSPVQKKGLREVDNTITLIRIAMIVPTKQGIYAPSQIDNQPRQITEDEFMNRYADHARAIQVSFEPDGVSNPQLVTAYGFGSVWWIAE